MKQQKVLVINYHETKHRWLKAQTLYIHFCVRKNQEGGFELGENLPLMIQLIHRITLETEDETMSVRDRMLIFFFFNLHNEYYYLKGTFSKIFHERSAKHCLHIDTIISFWQKMNIHRLCL